MNDLHHGDDLQGCSGFEGEIVLGGAAPLHHAVDHDVGQAVAAPAPGAQVQAVGLQGLEPVHRLTYVLALKQANVRLPDIVERELKKHIKVSKEK